MVTFTIKVNPVQRIAYIPLLLYEELGPLLNAIADHRSAVIYPKETPLEDVLQSVRIIAADLELRVKEENRRGAVP